MSTASSTVISASPTTYQLSSITSYTNLGPIPTPITFLPNCKSQAYIFQENGIGVPYTYHTFGCPLSSCFPSSRIYSTPFEWYSNYYSPGACPVGFTINPADPIFSTGSAETIEMVLALGLLG